LQPQKTNQILEGEENLESKPVLPRGRNFGRKSQKGREIKLTGPGKSGAELLPDLSKKGRKGGELFSSRVFHKIIYISCPKDYTY
jgi:hypothetical protein